MSECFCFDTRCIHGPLIEGYCLAEGPHAPATEWTLACGHVYHAHCLAKWYLTNPTCPECRARIVLPRPSGPLVFRGLDDVCRKRKDIYTICSLQDHPFRPDPTAPTVGAYIESLDSVRKLMDAARAPRPRGMVEEVRILASSEYLRNCKKG